jgi:hypothetical protein
MGVEGGVLGKSRRAALRGGGGLTGRGGGKKVGDDSLLVRYVSSML